MAANLGKPDANALLMATGPERLLSMAAPDGLATMPCAFAAHYLNPKRIRAGVGDGRPQSLSGFDTLVRFHIVLGHASHDDVICTVCNAVGIQTPTAADIKRFRAWKCGICISCKLNRRSFARIAEALADATLPHVGKWWTFDSLSLLARPQRSSRMLF